MEYRHDDFSSRNPLLVHFGRNTATIIPNADRFIRVNNYADFAAMTRKGLINGIVDQLKNHVVQARTIIGITDIHPWALADSI